MNCSEIEDLLPRYAERDLSPEQERLVALHLETCEHCRESYALYARLEQALEGLKIELPSPEVVTREVMRRARSVSERRRFSPAAIWSFPVMANVLIILAGVILFTYREGVAKLVSKVGTGYVNGIEQFSEKLPIWISQAFGGDYWMLVLTCTLSALVMILAGGYITVRYAIK
jgi:predicted anti-sigma-YlaC factor YlaD